MIKNREDKIRLDKAVSVQYPQYSRSQAQALIESGSVKVNGTPVTKVALAVEHDAQITIEQDLTYVCRAGSKLAAALDAFKLDVKGLVCLDAGLSAGGFADCLLQRGVQKIYGVDVGHSQVHEKIAGDARVVVMEKTNLRNLVKLPELVDLVTLDLSFISVLKVIDVVHKLLKQNGTLIVLIKPQFEAGPADVPATGVITDTAVHERVITEVVQGIESAGFTKKDLIESPVLGGSGNKEYLAYFVKK